MKKSLIVFVLLIGFAAMLTPFKPCLAQLGEMPGINNINTGDAQHLERQLWADFKARNWQAVESKMSIEFQAVHATHRQGRSAEIALLRNLNLGEYRLSDFKVTQYDDIIVLTYMVEAQETIGGKLLSMQPSPRLSVWRKVGMGWQWVAHANPNR